MKNKILQIGLNIIVFSFLIMLNGCQSKDANYKELISIDKTHSLINPKLKKSIDQVLNNNTDFGDFDTQVILINISKNETNYEVCISRTDYNIFKKNRPDNFNNLKGYLSYNNIPVLLFGDVDNVFFKRSNAKFNNVLGNMPKYDKDNPPIVYEPRMICSELN